MTEWLNLKTQCRSWHQFPNGECLLNQPNLLIHLFDIIDDEKNHILEHEKRKLKSRQGN